MKSIALWVVFALLVEVSCYFMLPRMIPEAANIKYLQSRKSKIVARNRFKENKRRALLKYKPQSFRWRDRMDGLKKVPPEEKKYIVQIFTKTRQYDRMQWTYLNKIVSDEPLKATLDGIYAGGIEGEASLRALEFNISNALYTRARNGRIGLRNSTRSLVFTTLPQLQKTNPKMMEFGYRLLDGDRSGEIFPITHAMTGIPTVPTYDELIRQYRKNTPVVRMDAHKLASDEIIRIMQSKRKTASLGKLSSHTDPPDLVAICPALFEGINSFINECMKSGIERLVLTADGGALMSGERDCVMSNAGVFILPEDNTLHRVEQSSRLRKALYGRHIATMDTTHGLSPLMVRITGAECFIDTPFDAELLAGLAAVTLVNLLHRKYDRLSLGLRQPVSSQVISDSRAFLRTVVKAGGGSVGGQYGGGPSESVDPKSTRGTLTSLLTNQLRLLVNKDSIDETSSSSEMAATRRCLIKWMMGHPEKRESDANKWSTYDIGSFMADEMAKPTLFAPPERLTLYDDDSDIKNSVYYRDQLKNKYPHYFRRGIIEIPAADLVRLACHFDDFTG